MRIICASDTCISVPILVRCIVRIISIIFIFAPQIVDATEGLELVTAAINKAG